MPKLTKRPVDALQPGDSDYFVRDSEIKGFGIRISRSGATTHLPQYREGGRTRRVSLGRHGNITVDRATLSAGMPIQMLGRLLGHSQLQTMRYAHPANDPVKQAAEENVARLSAAIGSPDVRRGALRILS